MLTSEGQAYLEGALFLLQYAYTEHPVEEYEIAEFLCDTAPELSQPTRDVIAKALVREAQNPDQLKQDLIDNGWIKYKN